jgi:opacity protein-like surface antigen
MHKPRNLVLCAALVAAAALIAASAASAANTPTTRDCSAFVEGFDPDFVELFDVTVGTQGQLTVPRSQHQVQLEASESSDPGDSSGHVTLTAKISTPDAPTRTISGAAIGKVRLSIPLLRRRPGRSYTIDWNATFDNGNHPCPSPFTPENTSPNPFQVTVS